MRNEICYVEGLGTIVLLWRIYVFLNLCPVSRRGWKVLVGFDKGVHVSLPITCGSTDATAKPYITGCVVSNHGKWMRQSRNLFHTRDHNLEMIPGLVTLMCLSCGITHCVWPQQQLNLGCACKLRVIRCTRTIVIIHRPVTAGVWVKISPSPASTCFSVAAARIMCTLEIAPCYKGLGTSLAGARGKYAHHVGVCKEEKSTGGHKNGAEGIHSGRIWVGTYNTYT